MPDWLLALQLAMQLEPAIAAAIELAKLPALTPEQMAFLQAQRDEAINKFKDRKKIN